MKILAENRFAAYDVVYIAEITNWELRVLVHLLETSIITVVDKNGKVNAREPFEMKPGDVIPIEEIEKAGEKINEILGASREIRKSLKILKSATTRVENALSPKGGEQ